MSDQRQIELFEQIRSKLRQKGYSTIYASNVKDEIENALQTYAKQIPTKVPRKEIKTSQQTLDKLQNIRNKALILSILLLFVIFPSCLIFWSIYQSFDTCNGLFGDSIDENLSWHKHYKKFVVDYSKFYNPKNQTDLYKYPWLVRIIEIENNTTKFFCSGFLINDRNILTAGHCFYLQATHEIYLGGTHENNYTDALRIKNDEFKILLHPKYQHQKQKNDIAILRLNNPVTFSETIYPIRLPFFKPFLPKNLTLTGWNKSDQNLIPELIERVIPIIPSAQCEQKANKKFDEVAIGTFYQERICNKFCGGYEDTSIEQGDSGMSIQLMDKNGPVAFGIISTGTKAGIVGLPQIFTNIYPYLHWILCNAGEEFCKEPNKN